MICIGDLISAERRRGVREGCRRRVLYVGGVRISARTRVAKRQRTMLIRCVSAAEFESPAGSPNSKFNKHIPARGVRGRWR